MKIILYYFFSLLLVITLISFILLHHYLSKISFKNMKFALFLLSSLLMSSLICADEYGYFESAMNDEVVLKEGEALVVLASDKNSPSPGSGHEYNLLVETDSGTLHELNFYDLNGTSYRGSTYENKSYGFAYAATSSESRTIAGPCKIRINKNFYVAYKIIRKD